MEKKKYYPMSQINAITQHRGTIDIDIAST